MIGKIIEMPTPFNMIVLVVLIGTLGSALSVVAKQVRIYFVIREELNFKRELASQGISASEIDRLMALRSSTSRSTNS